MTTNFGTPLPGVAYFRRDPARIWNAPGRLPLEGGDDSGVWTDPFTTGMKPNSAALVGVGIYQGRPAPTTVISGNVTYSTSQTIEDKVFNGFVTVNNGAFVIFINCEFKGGVATGTRPAVLTTASGLTTFKFCTIYCQFPDARLSCIGDKNYRCERCNVYWGVDIFGAFSKPIDPDPKCNITIIETWAHDMVRFAPDTANNRTETHNDVIQLQGNIGPDDDIYIEGSAFEGYHSGVVGDIPNYPTDYKQLSAVMLTPNQRSGVRVTIKNSWLSGGVYTLNASYALGGQETSVLRVINTKFEKPHGAPGPSAAIGIDPVIVNKTFTNITYESDGTTVVPIGA